MAYQHVGTWSFESFIHIETSDLASDVLVVFHKVRRATVCVLFGCLVFQAAWSLPFSRTPQSHFLPFSRTQLMVLAPLMQFLLLDVCKCYPSNPFQCNWIFFAFLSIMQVTSQTLRGPLGQYQMVSSSPRIDLLFKHLIFNSFLDFFLLVFWGS